MNALNISIKILDKSIDAPAYAHVGDAAVDLRCRIPFSLEPFQRACIPCGISLEIPEGFAGLVLPRSGLAVKHGISVVNAPGLIDSNYRGEICAVLINLDPVNPFCADAGERIAQLMIVPAYEARFTPVDELSQTERGQRGFGSSGTQ